MGSSLEVIEEDGKVYVVISGENKEIKILAQEAIERAKKVGVVNKIEIKEEKERAVYSVTGTKRARLFFIIPINAHVEQNIDIEDGSIVSTKRPWWHIFALGV